MTVTTVEVGTYLSEVFPVDLPSGVYLNKVIVASRSKAGRGCFQEVL